jgi:hypothetical protein
MRRQHFRAGARWSANMYVYKHANAQECECKRTYVFSCRTNEEKLLCLKYFGSMAPAKRSGSFTTKLHRKATICQHQALKTMDFKPLHYKRPQKRAGKEC